VKAVLGLWRARAGADLQYCKRNDLPQSIANPGDHDGKDEECPSHDGSAGGGIVAAGLIAHHRLRRGVGPAVPGIAPDSRGRRCNELRVLRAALDGRAISSAPKVLVYSDWSTLAGCYDYVVFCGALSAVALVSSCVTINLERPESLVRCCGRSGRVRRHTTRGSDVFCLRKLHLDIDPCPRRQLELGF